MHTSFTCQVRILEQFEDMFLIKMLVKSTGVGQPCLWLVAAPNIPRSSEINVLGTNVSCYSLDTTRLRVKNFSGVGPIN